MNSLPDSITTASVIANATATHGPPKGVTPHGPQRHSHIMMPTGAYIIRCSSTLPIAAASGTT